MCFVKPALDGAWTWRFTFSGVTLRARHDFTWLGMTFTHRHEKKDPEDLAEENPLPGPTRDTLMRSANLGWQPETGAGITLPVQAGDGSLGF